MRILKIEKSVKILKEDVEDVEVPLSIHKKTKINHFCEDIKEEIKVEESLEDTLTNQQEKGKL